MTVLTTDHWRYLSSPPIASGKLKVNPEDFVVREVLGYEPTGEGEHIYLWIRKTGLNTAFVAEQIAKFCNLPLRAITYAGRKDKHAVTEQWIGVHKPGKADYNWQDLKLDGLEIVKAIRHNKKLRTGVLKGNQFELVIRDVSAPEDVEPRLDEIRKHGVPNYYGQQRFGDSRHHPNGGNLALAEKMMEGEEIRNRNKRSMAISALRSWLFNEFVSERISAGTFTEAQSGDALILAGSNSFFVETEITEQTRERLAQRDIQISAPLWGQGELASQETVKSWEENVVQPHANIAQMLETLGLKQERRAISLYPEQMEWSFSDTTLSLKFALPSGCFATSVVRELVNLEQTEESQ